MPTTSKRQDAHGKRTHPTERAVEPPAEENDPAPFWTWGWRRAPLWRKSWYAYRMAKPVVGFAGVVAALVLLVEVAPKVYAPIAWRGEEYASLREIHAGYELDYVSERLGSPAMVDRVGVDGGASYRELIYARRQHFVQVVVDDDDRVLLYAVTSCDADFRPIFDAGEGIEVQLQRRSVREAAQPVPPSPPVPTPVTVDELESRRLLHYRSGLTSTSPEFFLESWGGSLAERNRHYFFGVNTLCVQPSEYGRLAGVDYIGGVSGVPPKVQAIRTAVSANTYAETAPGVGGDLSDEGMVRGLNANVGPDGFSLPPNFEGTGSTRLP